MANSVQERGCEYQQLPNGIHEFVFTNKGDSGLDEFFATLYDVIINAPVDSTLRYIVDVMNIKAQGSMSELVKRFRKLETQFPERAQGRTAIIHKPGLLITFANTFITTLAPGQDKSRFFTPDKRDEAMMWLLQNE